MKECSLGVGMDTRAPYVDTEAEVAYLKKLEAEAEALYMWKRKQKWKREKFRRFKHLCDECRN